MKSKINQNASRRHGGVTAVLAVLLLAAVILINGALTVLTRRYGWTWDLRPEEVYPVDEACYTYLDKYVRPALGDRSIRIVFCDEEETVRADRTFCMALDTAEELQAHYPGMISIDYLNIWEHPSVARVLGVTDKDSVAVICGDRAIVCALRDFFVFSQSDASLPMAYQGDRRLAVAMHAVAGEDQPTCYLTLNHGETYEDYELLHAISDAGYRIGYLDLLTQEVPDDCALLITYRPTRDFTDGEGVTAVSELDRLDAYMRQGGRYMVFVSADTFAAAPFSCLEGYLAEWGVTFAHEAGDSGQECLLVRDPGHGLTSDGYTFLARTATEGTAGAWLAETGSAVRMSNATFLTPAEGFLPDQAGSGGYVRGSYTLYPLLTAHQGAEAWRAGRPVDRVDRGEEGFCLMGMTHWQGEEGQDAYLMACTSTEFAGENTMTSAVYENRSVLFRVMEAMGHRGTPVGLGSHPLADNAIHSLTLRQARAITWTLIAIPAILCAAVGTVVLVRRRTR